MCPIQVNIYHDNSESSQLDKHWMDCTMHCLNSSRENIQPWPSTHLWYKLPNKQRKMGSTDGKYKKKTQQQQQQHQHQHRFQQIIRYFPFYCYQMSCVRVLWIYGIAFTKQTRDLFHFILFSTKIAAGGGGEIGLTLYWWILRL